MSSPSFVVTPYYETCPPYAVGPEEAVAVYSAAVGYLAAYTGQIMLQPPEGIALPESEYPLFSPAALPFRNDEHTALLTRGPLEVCGNEAKGFSDNVGSAGQLVVKLPRRLLGARKAAVSVAVHELGHSFGLTYEDAYDGQADSQHCPDKVCIMYEELGPQRRGSALLRSNPFCGDCSEQLRNLGAAGIAKHAGDIL